MNKALLIRMGQDKLGWHEFERSVISTDEYMSLKARKKNYNGKGGTRKWCKRYQVRVDARKDSCVYVRNIYIWQGNDNLLPLRYW